MRKKEIIFIIVLILITLILAFTPIIYSYFSKEETFIMIDEEEEAAVEGKFIYITLKGDGVNSTLKLKLKKGISWSQVKEIIVLYIKTNAALPEYSLDYQFNNDTTIIIGSPSSSNESLLINVNTASLRDLEELTGIGEKKANKIIEYRKTKKIESFDELRIVVGGLSNADFEQIQNEAVCE